MFSIDNLSVSIDDKSILKNLSLEIAPGQVHAIMGPNGSGKSTLAQSIMGISSYEVTDGVVRFDGVTITNLPAHQRAQRGIFLSFQQPPAIPGLRVFTLLKEMRQTNAKESFDLTAFMQEVKGYLELLSMDHSFLERNCNDGFSGGERKRFELLQLLVARPKVLILDEIDSGLDIDALKLVAKVLQKVKADNPDLMTIIITHYNRILEHIVPDYVHVLVNGQIVQSSDAALVPQLEQTGYANLL
jgi:Fe-S cluster assembly ATP-binding protein